MTTFIKTLSNNIETIIAGFYDHLEAFPVSTIFLVFVVFCLFVNLFRIVLLRMERKRTKPHESCQYLVVGTKGPDCDLPSRRKRFKKNNDSCEDCPGKSFKLTDSEAESRIASSATWKRAIISLATYSNAVLPYVSFIYTLVATIFESTT